MNGSRKIPRPPGDFIPVKGYKSQIAGRVMMAIPESLCIYQELGNCSPRYIRPSLFYLPIFKHTAADFRLPLYVDISLFPILHKDEEQPPQVAAPQAPTANGTLSPQCKTCGFWLSPVSAKYTQGASDLKPSAITCKACDTNDCLNYQEFSDQYEISTCMRAILDTSRGVMDLQVHQSEQEITEASRAYNLHVFIVEFCIGSILNVLDHISSLASYVSESIRLGITIFFVENTSMFSVYYKNSKIHMSSFSLDGSDFSPVPKVSPYVHHLPQDSDTMATCIAFVRSMIMETKPSARVETTSWLAAIAIAINYISNPVAKTPSQISCILNRTPLQPSFHGQMDNYSAYITSTYSVTKELIKRMVLNVISFNVLIVGDKIDADPGYETMVDSFITCLVRNTGGYIADYPKYRSYRDDEPLRSKLWNQLTQYGGYDVTCKVRLCKGLRVKQLLAPWSDALSRGGGANNAADVFRVPYVDIATSFCVQCSQAQDLDCLESKKGYIQVVARYTDPITHLKRVRVMTLSLEMSPSISSIYRFADNYAYMNGMSRSLVLDQIRQKEAHWEKPTSKPEDFYMVQGLLSWKRSHLMNKDDLMDVLVANLLTYRLHCVPGGYLQQLILPEGLKMLPLALSSVPKLYSSGCNINLILRGSQTELSLLLTPRLFVISNGMNGDEIVSNDGVDVEETLASFGRPLDIDSLCILPPSIPVTMESVRPGGVYLLLTLRNIYIYLTKNALCEWENVTRGLYVEEPGAETTLGTRTRSVIDTLMIKHQIRDRPPVWVLYEGHADENLFHSHLLEDSIGGSPSYNQYIRYLHKSLHRQYNVL